ncbi:MAG: hypothetical protein AAGE52_26775 [Myxococcota bacterium]
MKRIRPLGAVLAGAVLAGLASAFVVIAGVQWLNFVLFPPPEGTNFDDPAQVEAILESLPVAALLMLELSYALGSIVGGAVAGWVHSGRAALVVGGVLTLLGVLNLRSIPHPLWLAVLTTVTYLPMCGLGAYLARRRLER